jgi:hypothetical protein
MKGGDLKRSMGGYLLCGAGGGTPNSGICVGIACEVSDVMAHDDLKSKRRDTESCPELYYGLSGRDAI